MSNYLFTADIHLTDHPADQYRFDIFPWLQTRLANKPVDALFILGDLTDRKDEHPATLVHKITDGLLSLAEYCPVHILKGNHDYILEDSPFFKFLNDYRKKIYFHDKPKQLKLGSDQFLLLPHTRDSHYYPNYDFKSPDFVLIHQPITGAVGNNGRSMEGIKPIKLAKAKRIIAGDVHVPQTVGENIIYCGSPYPINFGDEFQPRILAWEDGKLRSIPRPTIRKAVLTIERRSDLRQSGLQPGDRARVTYSLPRSEYVHWDRYRRKLERLAKEMGIELWGVKLAERDGQRTRDDPAHRPTANPADTLTRFAKARRIDPELLEIGKGLLT